MAAACQVLRALARRIGKATGWRRWPETSGSQASRSAARKQRSKRNLHRKPGRAELSQRRHRKWRIGGGWRRPRARAHPAAAAAAAPPQPQRHTATALTRPLAESSAGSRGKPSGPQGQRGQTAGVGRTRCCPTPGVSCLHTKRYVFFQKTLGDVQKTFQKTCAPIGRNPKRRNWLFKKKK